MSHTFLDDEDMSLSVHAFPGGLYSMWWTPSAAYPGRHAMKSIGYCTGKKVDCLERWLQNDHRFVSWCSKDARNSKTESELVPSSDNWNSITAFEKTARM